MHMKQLSLLFLFTIFSFSSIIAADERPQKRSRSTTPGHKECSIATKTCSNSEESLRRKSTINNRLANENFDYNEEVFLLIKAMQNMTIDPDEVFTRPRSNSLPITSRRRIK